MPELWSSTHSPLVQSAGPTAPVSAPNALTKTSEIHMSPLQAVDLLEVLLGITTSDSLSFSNQRRRVGT